MRLLSFLLLTCALATGHADEGVYARLGLGAGWLDNTATGVGSADFDPGVAAGGSLGYDFGKLRLEADLYYRSNDIDQLDGASGGDFASLGAGFSALVDFNLLGHERATSYVGAGVVLFEEIDIDLPGGLGGGSFSGDDVGWQALAGVEYTLSDRWRLNLEVRHVNAGEVTLRAEDGSGTELRADYGQTSLLLGVGYRF